MKAFILFTRIPKENYTKTRLMSHLTGKQCEQLHFCFLEDLYNTLNKLKDVKIFICYAPENKENLLSMNIPASFISFEQQGQSLGERMENAFLYVKKLGFKKTILTGADVPHLALETIENGFSELQYNDVVIGGTKDGGYYLIGMKNNVYSSLFYLPTSWGTYSVYEETKKLIEKQSLKVKELEKMIDIDTWEDIEALKIEQLPCVQTKAFLSNLRRVND